MGGNPVAFGKLHEAKPTEWVIDGLMAKGSLLLLTGARQSGKTILALSLVQGVATEYVFLMCQCAKHPVAYFNRYESKAELWKLANEVTRGRLTAMDVVAASVYGSWDADEQIPDIEDGRLDSLAKAGTVLVFDTIPDPKEITNPEAFLRRARRLANSGPGVVMFGSRLWDRVQSTRNMPRVHLKLTKAGNRIVVEAPKQGRKASVDLSVNQLGGLALSVSGWE
jgi:AAA domain